MYTNFFLMGGWDETAMLQQEPVLNLAFEIIDKTCHAAAGASFEFGI